MIKQISVLNKLRKGTQSSLANVSTNEGNQTLTIQSTTNDFLGKLNQNQMRDPRKIKISHTSKINLSPINQQQNSTQ